MSGGGSGDPTDGAENIRVAVRCRPLNARERNEGASVVFKREGSSTVVLSDPASGTNAPRRFAFDFVYDDKAEQHELFRDVGRPILDRAFAGFNGTIFAYGQTGSGKTWSMNGAPTPASRGLIPRMNEALFERVARETAASSRKRFLVVCSFFEIYNEIIYDLLATGGDGDSGADTGFSTRSGAGGAGGSKGRGLEVKEHPLLGVYVKGLQEVVVDSNERIEELMTRGQAQRSVGATMMNADSSRSHSVFVIKVHQKLEKADGNAADGGGGGEEEEEGNVFAKVNLVDLAGSERADRTGAAGARLREGANINKSLAALGNVINGLVAKARAEQTRSGKSVFIPYRDSKLTRVLQESLGGNALCTMVATLSPAATSFSESLSTLQYANRAKAVTVKAVRNEGKSSETRLQEEIRQLKSKLAKAQAGNAPGAGGGLLGGAQASSVGHGAEEAAQAKKQAARFRAQIEEMEAMAQQSWEDKQKESQKYDAELKRAESERREAETRVLLERERRWEALCAQGEPEVTLKEVEAELLRAAAKAQGEHDSDALQEIGNTGGRRKSKAEQLHSIRKRQAEASGVGRRLRSLRAIKRQVREQRGLARLFARAFEGELAKWRALRLTTHAQHVVPASSPSGDAVQSNSRALTELEEARERALVEQVRGKLAALEQEAKKLGELEERHASTARSLAAAWTSPPPPAAPGSPESSASERGSASRVELILAQQLTELARTVRQGTRNAMAVLCQGDATSTPGHESPVQRGTKLKPNNKSGAAEESGEAAVICIRRAAMALIDSITALNCAGGGIEGGRETVTLSNVLGVDPPLKASVPAADAPVNDDRLLTFAEGSSCSISLLDEDAASRGTCEVLREAPADGWFEWNIPSLSSLPSSLRVAIGCLEHVRAVDVLVRSGNEDTNASESFDGQPDTTWKLCGKALGIHNGGGWKALLGTDQQAPIVRLLQRPPVRFVHDLVVALRKAIGQRGDSSAVNFAQSAIQAVATPAAPPDVAQPKDELSHSLSDTAPAATDSSSVVKSPQPCDTQDAADAKSAGVSSEQSPGQAKAAAKLHKDVDTPPAKRQAKAGAEPGSAAERLKSKSVRRRFVTSLISDLQQQLSMDAPADAVQADLKAQLDSISADDVVAGRDCHGANVLLQLVGFAALRCSKPESTATNTLTTRDAVLWAAMEPSVATDEVGTRFFPVNSEGRVLRRGDRLPPMQWPLHRGDGKAPMKRLWLGGSGCDGVDARHLMLRLKLPTTAASGTEGTLPDDQTGISLRLRVLLGAPAPKDMAVSQTAVSVSADLGNVLVNVSASMAGVWEELRDAEARRWREAAAARGARIRELERRAAAATAESERAGEATKELAILRAQLRDAKAEVAAANAAAAASAAEALGAMNAKEAAEIEAKEARDAATAAKEAVATAAKRAAAVEMSDRAKAASPVFCAEDPAAADELARKQSLAEVDMEAKLRAEAETKAAAKDEAHAMQLSALRDQLRQALSRAEASEIELAAAGGRAAAATEEADALLSKLQAAEDAVAAARREKAEAEAVAAAAEAQAEAAEAQRAEALLVAGRPQAHLAVDAKTPAQPVVDVAETAGSALEDDSETSHTDTRPTHEPSDSIVADATSGSATTEHNEDKNGDEYGDDRFDGEAEDEDPSEVERAAGNGMDAVDDVQDDAATALQARAQAARAATRLEHAEEQLEAIREEAAAATTRAVEAEEIVEEQKVLMRELWEQVEVAMEERDVSRTKEEELFAEVTEKDDEIEALKYAVEWLKSQVKEKQEAKEEQTLAEASLAPDSTQLLDAQEQAKRADERADQAHELVQQERAEVERLKIDMQAVQTQLQRLYGYATSEEEGATSVSASAAELCTKLLQIYSAHYGSSDSAHYADAQQHEPVQQPYPQQAPVQQPYPQQAPVQQPYPQQAPVQQPYPQQAPVQQPYPQQEYYEPPQQLYTETLHTEARQQPYAQGVYYEQPGQPIDTAGIAAGSAMNAVAVHRGSIPG